LNYSYLYINRLSGEPRKDLFSQLEKSVEVLKHVENNHGSIHIFTDSNDTDIKKYARQQGCFSQAITLSRNYNSTVSASLIDILVEKIIQLKDFDGRQDTVLLDVDTEFMNSVPENFWTTSEAVLWKAEYYITQFRNLENVLPHIPWKQVDIKYDNSFIMYNTGVVYIPKEYRKEICEKALWITDYLNNGTFDPSDRHGNKLDEQIGLSIAIHDAFGRQGKIKTCEHFIHHYWEEKTKGIRWWE